VHEARRVATIWRAAAGSGNSPVTELLEASATEAAFKQYAQGKSLVHVATHGFLLASRCMTDQVDIASPLRLSGLVFADSAAAKGRPAEDGVLLAEEVATIDFTQAQWVVLSGCDTGVGQIEIDEGILGLRRAFRVAGAGTLVSSLWPVEDFSAEAFMASLYEARLSGHRSTAASMREAYRDALATTKREHGHAHPLYWAPFIAAGDWR
jgi:CHAT domain-containing protein